MVQGAVQVECLHGEHFRKRAEARQALVESISYYHTERCHSVLGERSAARIPAFPEFHQLIMFTGQY